MLEREMLDGALVVSPVGDDFRWRSISFIHFSHISASQITTSQSATNVRLLNIRRR